MRVLLEFRPFCLSFSEFDAGNVRICGLLEGESYSRIYGSVWKVTSFFEMGSRSMGRYPQNLPDRAWS